MTTGIVIPAYMRSKRFPGKPLVDIGGRPLLSYAVEAARASELPFVVAYENDDDHKPVKEWCDFKSIDARPTPKGVRNGTERAARANNWMKWDRVIVLQCDEPDITSKHLKALSKMSIPSTVVTEMQEDDWGNPHSVAAIVNDGFEHKTVAFFTRGAPKPTKFEDDNISQIEKWRFVARHVGVYLYSAEMLETYLHHPATPAELTHSLEQLRTMAMGCAWECLDFETELDALRSVNVPEDVEKFDEQKNS